jgi:pimeloyl-[acyl-carrier protein] methyl ester esterase
VSALHVERLGFGPDVVMLHGWALHGGMWGPWLDSLAEHARLHVVDLPGHGHSAWRNGITDVAGLATSVFPAIPRGATVLGWSLGGMVALELARRHPQHIGSLVLIATTPRFVAGDGWQHGMRSDVLDGFARGLADDYRATVRNFLALQALGDENAAQALRALRSKLATHGEPDPRALVAGLGVLRNVDLRDDLPRIATPTLVIVGERDRLTPPEAGRELAMRLPSARFHVVERAGHAPFLSHPDEVLREVVPFLKRPSPALCATSPAGGRGKEPSPGLRPTSPAGGRGKEPSPALCATSPASGRGKEPSPGRFARRPLP